MMDWLRMEARLRAVLRHLNNGKCSTQTACYMMSDIIGEETGRGFELTKRPNRFAEAQAESSDVYSCDPHEFPRLNKMELINAGLDLLEKKGGDHD
jgi:hypothetical protein